MAQHARIDRKTNKLAKFENFLKDVQIQYSDEFTDLMEIITRYSNQADIHSVLKQRHEQSESAIDGINAQMDLFKKVAGTQSLEFTNKIAEEQKKLQEVESDKAKLMIGNSDKTEKLLKKTREHGIIKMSIKSLWEKLVLKSEKQKEVYFIWHKQQPRGSESAAEDSNFSQDQCLGQLDIIKTYIEGFDLFCSRLAEPIAEIDQAKINHKLKQTYFHRMTETLLQAKDGEVDGIEDFTYFDPNPRI